MHQPKVSWILKIFIVTHLLSFSVHTKIVFLKFHQALFQVVLVMIDIE